MKAILFDMVGPLLTKNPNYKSDIVVETADPSAVFYCFKKTATIKYIHKSR